MMKRFFILFAWLPIIAAGQRLEECLTAAERNYPLIRQYDLVARTTDLTLSSIQRGWLPQLSVNAQVSYQSDVTSWPEQIQAMYQQAGLDMKGLDRLQYRVGLDLNQPVYDGGVMHSRQRVTRAEGEVQAAQTEVTLYQVRQRVNELFFSLLLVQEQLRLNSERTFLLQENEKTVTSLYNRGTASESEVQMIRAEVLDAHRQQTTLTSQQRALQRMLSLFCGMEVTEPVKPEEWSSLSEELNRPELKLVEAQLRLANAQERALNSALTPRLSVFASGFYGYPGYNLFHNMMHRNGSLNGIVGARLTWSLSPFYTRRNDRAKIQVQREMVETNRELFLFNTRLERLRQDEQTEQYRQLIAEDPEKTRRICRELIARYELDMLILTCGAIGSYVFTASKESYVATPKVQVADTVGAGDSFTATFVAQLLLGKTIREAHEKAVAVSAYVCTQRGAMPLLPAELKA